MWTWLLAGWLICGLWGTSGYGQGESPANSAPVEAAFAPESTEPPAHDAAGHNDPHGESGSHSVVAPLLAALVLVIFLAKVGGDLFTRIGLPLVLGELTIGVLIGNMALLTGWHGLDFLHAPEASAAVGPYVPGAQLKILAEIGVILLLFEVGLESNVAGMMRVGLSSLVVAVLGVVAPMLLGFGIGMWLIPEEGWQVHLFLGATLCATSVGITARVLKDLGRSTQRESQIILGAAVIDDVLGLLVLAVVSGIIAKGEAFELSSLVWESSPDGIGWPGILVMSVGFLAIAVILGGVLFTKPLFKAASYLEGHGLLVATALVICFGLSYIASVVQLAPIVGAFAAGLILEHAQYKDLSTRENWELERAISPLTAIFVPIFFVQMGIEVNLESFTNPAVWGLAAAVTVVAIIGKQVCALGVMEKGLDRLSVGLGMIPRGEVGLIFAAAGKALMDSSGEPVVSDDIYSAIIVMVILTTMVTPPLLKWSMTRNTPGQTGSRPTA